MYEDLYRNTEIQKYRNTEIQKYRNTEIQKYRSGGETLIETLISLSMFMLIIAPAAMMYSSNFRLLSSTRNNIIAANLAEEALEVIQGMRDSNFLRFPDKAQQCWNTKPDWETLDRCEYNKIGDENDTVQNFRLTVELADFSWKLEPETATLDPASNIEKYRLLQDANTDMYFSPTSGADISNSKQIPFYRQISIKYLNTPSAVPEAMKVTSLVQYQSSSGQRNIKRMMILTNRQL